MRRHSRESLGSCRGREETQGRPYRCRTSHGQCEGRPGEGRDPGEQRNEESGGNLKSTSETGTVYGTRGEIHDGPTSL